MKSFSFPSISISVGGILFVASFLIYNWVSSSPISFPLGKNTEISSSPIFSVRRNTTYEINWEADQDILGDKLYCLLGVERHHPERCQGLLTPINFEWSLISNGNLIAHGTSEKELGGGYSFPIVYKIIGKVELVRGAKYSLNTRYLSDPSELDRAKSRIVVAVNSDEIYGSAIISQLLTIIALLLIVIGVIIHTYRKTSTSIKMSAKKSNKPPS